jgi:hypothetical protein
VSDSFPAEPVRWASFVGWLVLGVGLAFGLLSIMTVGIFVLPLEAIAMFLYGRRGSSASGHSGLVSGAGLPLFYVAFLNRAGPGDVCRGLGGGGEECVQEWSPWPWLVAGLLLLVAGLGFFVLARHGPADPREASADRRPAA